MTYIVYCLDIRTHYLEIITIENEEKDAKITQNSHSFELLCELNKKESLYKLELKNNVIQIIEININIQNGWISDKVSEIKKPIFEIGVIKYEYKKEKFNLSIEEKYIEYKSTNNQIKDTKHTKDTNKKEDISKNSKCIKDQKTITFNFNDVLNELKNKKRI